MSSLELAVLTVIGAALVGACLLLYHLMVQNGRVLLRLEALERQMQARDTAPLEPRFPAGLKVGTGLGDFSLASLEGGTATLSQWKGRRVLLIFFDPRCAFCVRFLEELATFTRTTPNLPAVPLFVSRGDPAENRRLFEPHDIRFPVLLQEDSEVVSLFNVPGTPAGYVVDGNGATASELLVGGNALMAALGSSAGKPAAGRTFTPLGAENRVARDGLKAGAPAPDFTLPSLNGTELSLKDYRGRRVLLVFSDPECQPCNRVAQELENIHKRSNGNGLQVLMVSRGEPRANEKIAAEFGLTFPIVLQRHWEVSKAYAMFATPIGYLIDEHGILASDAAVGVEPILKLAS